MFNLKRTPGLRRLAVAVLALMAIGAPAWCTTIWDAGTNFSLAGNPNGQWTYGSEATLGGALSAFTFADTASGLQAWASSANYPGQDATAYVGHNPTGSSITYTTFSVP